MADEYKAIWPIPTGHPSFEGDIPKLRRFLSGLYSLDKALAGPRDTPGIPLRGGIEVFGRWETGKSTLGYYIAGRVPNTKKIVLVDLEGGAREEYLRTAVAQSGYSGLVYRVPFEASGKIRTHEDMLKEGADALLEEGTNALILDSAAMTQPVPEREGDIEEAFMGRRAQVLAKFMRRSMAWINSSKEDKILVVINHMLMNMQGFKISPGGDTMKFGIHARLWIHRTESLQDGVFEAEIEVDKLRFGGKDKERKARVVFLPGIGVSPELTAMFDCMALGEARRQQGTGMVQIKEGEEWKSIARTSAMIKKAMEGQKDDFAPFFERLASL